MNALIVFVKNPIPGTVKTRLQARYTPEQAAAIYTAFVCDTLHRAENMNIDRRIIAYDPPNAETEVGALCGTRWNYVAQVQEDLGERMHTALAQQLKTGASSAVLIGTDIPSLPTHHITQAFDLLREKDVVLGPSTDGGYYLVGFSRPAPETFLNIDWSTSSVLSQTIDQIENAGYSLGLVPPWFDVDTPEELDILLAHARAQKLATGKDPLPHTHACLCALT